MNDDLAVLKALIADNMVDPVAKAAALEIVAQLGQPVKKEVFLFYDSETGLYGGAGLANTRKPYWGPNRKSSDENPPQWDKRGKVWTTSGALKNHLHLVSKYKAAVLPDNWRVLRCWLMVTENLPANDVLNSRGKNGE
jgi:hypothetical protein